MKMENGVERAGESQDSHLGGFCDIPGERAYEQTSRKQMPGVGLGSHAARGQRKKSATWAGGGGFWKEKKDK